MSASRTVPEKEVMTNALDIVRSRMERLSGYLPNEFVEFAQLFISDGETILIEDTPKTRPSTRGRWVQGWFMVTPIMVDRYRLAKEGRWESE